MSKKNNQKKKVGIKLSSGQSYLIEDLEVLLHIQKTYASMMRGQVSEQDKVIYNRVIAAVNTAIQNVYVGTDNGSDEDYWN